MKQHYETLGLNEGASQQEIQAAYDRLCNELDPVKHNNEEFFVEEYKKVQEAYKALSNSSILATEKGAKSQNSPQSDAKEKESEPTKPPKVKNIFPKPDKKYLNRKSILIIVLVGVLSFGGYVIFNKKSFSRIPFLSIKVAYVNYAEVMNQYEAKKELEGQFQARAQRFERKRDSISQAFQYEAQLFQQRAQRMPESSAQKEYNALQSRGQTIGQQLQMEEQSLQEQGEIKMDSLIKLVRSKIEDYGKEHGFSYILAGGEGGTVLYGADEQNITEGVITFLNTKD